jgi:hypothetical protein
MIFLLGQSCYSTHSIIAIAGNTSFAASGQGIAAGSWGILCSKEGSEGCMELAAVIANAIKHS